MKTVTKTLKSFWREEEGMEMSEYAVVGVIICLMTAAAFIALSGGIAGGIGRITTCVSHPSAANCTP